MKKFSQLVIVFVLSLISFTQAQNLPSSALYHDLLKFKETKRILYVAAHPDDENTRLIGYLANAEHAQVAYLSLTRGDGGQNLIGKELGIELGYIRTHELMKARERDGGRQLFSRALDFGFSKNPDETLMNWDKEKLLSDVVWIIRKFQPDIIINRFNTIPGTTHGHHTTSAILSSEAFEISDRADVFPEQLKTIKPWKVRRIFWNAYSWGGQYEPKEDKQYHTFSTVGDFNPLLGETYSQIAADSRTMHKSQGFGSTSQIGKGNDFIELVKGEPFTSSPFDGIPNRWLEIVNGKEIETKIDQLLASFQFIQPTQHVQQLLEIRRLLNPIQSNDVWVAEKKEHLDRMILQTLGVKAEFIIKKEIGYPGEELSTEFVFNNPSGLPLRIQSFQGQLFNQSFNQIAVNNQVVVYPLSFRVPVDYPVSQPFWLANGIENSLFDIQDPSLIGPPINEPSIAGTALVEVDGQIMHVTIPLRYKYNDQVDGEIQQPFTLVPEVNVSLDKNNVFLIPGARKDLRVEVSFRNELKQNGSLQVDGLESSQYKVELLSTDERRKRMVYSVTFLDSDQLTKQVGVRYVLPNGQSFAQDTKRIIYKHIPNLTYFTDTKINLVKMDLKISGGKVAYIQGAGDDVPEILRSLGYDLTILDDAELNQRRFAEFKTVIIGIRAFNVNQSLANNVDQLMEYVKEGGNVIVQYNTSSPLLTRELGPYPFSISRDRVTVEGSPVQVAYNHRLMAYPNKVTASDFEGWVQERGLYFASNWDANYQTPFTMNDPGENPTQGSLLFTTFGKGTYTYSGISWFRQLPAGVPGAIKIFVNLIEQGNGK
ncbi:PIG-L family deacetylase [Mongoliitalea daihaiensis]|uniref:PIG-L family deacetylase n=1 Tax=Mongoliitalea daihaiensis TaxID=2782006 RepID=UPI001F31F830|nr:PIG-L family deacetylase [Mongoliitalea daihaiensis]UJP64298.1 PIG-L family deacetylase [Mongoliitalea daihaiensis]